MRRRVLLAIILAVSLSASTSASGVVSVVSMDDLFNAITHSAAVTVSSYVLPATSPMARALIQAAHNGSDVVVVLDSETIGAGAQASVAQTVSVLSRAGVKVRMSVGPTHVKAALLDRRIVYLSDRNFTTGGAVVISSDDPNDYDAIVDSLEHGPGNQSPHLRVYKRDALALEASIIQHGSGPLDVETESMSAGNPGFRALLERSRRSHIRLIVSGDELEDGHHQREQEEVSQLQRAGIDVRVGRSNEKIAVEAGDGFVGSANLSGGSAAVQAQPDWGMAIDPGPVLEALRQHFGADWSVAAQAR